MLIFDLRQTLIPFSLLQVANAFGKMKPGEEMEIYAEIDAFVLEDVMRILPCADYDVICRDDLSGDDPAARLKLRKKSTLKKHQPKENHHVSNRSEFPDCGQHRGCQRKRLPRTTP